ncbi:MULTISPECIES: indolepyruvate ferredoxin oxidoreductase subunit alpha [unclassified Romboutsia]|uniref:indolepyruvate ferredoxin oxidoreductase subunit alpha n=1 Tax=unclassified Romboutsia TaxID=2626894 RepID=UPI0008231104|nr:MULTISPECIES: indolepyruvate ferredoxin oxidoreductase subunit alpha [unclassified Romboutsia]SCH39149.1 indolepyruvate ferredoxin oxidoreductase [uncultured Clostridium sp.]
MKQLMTGNEAIARGAYEAGVKFAAGYPGTPSTEILENIAKYKDSIKAEWSVNEKVAVESVIGASIAGARSIATMKQVGLNVAADPLFTYSYIGVNGGTVIVSADEPGMHSSQNEQDNRNYAIFSKIPLLEPSTSQEAKDMVKIAFDISERFDTPVLIRVTTRVCHSKGIVECLDRNEVEIKPYRKNVAKNLTVPIYGRVKRIEVEKRIQILKEFSNSTNLNYYEINSNKIGIVASGMCVNFAKEVFFENASYMKLGFTNPLPINKIKEFASKVEKIYVIEENDSIIEEQLKANNINCIGKEIIPAYGELTPEVIRKSILKEEKETIKCNENLATSRPAGFCAGCPHRGFFYELGKRNNLVIAGDIGCYSLAFAQPYNATDFIICMGASVSAGHGAQTIFNMKQCNKTKVVNVIGDSTFFHSGITSLLNTVYNKGDSITVILDNRITGMTGYQQNPGTGYTLQNDKTKEIDIYLLVKACGVENIKLINPNKLDEVNDALDWALSNEDGPSVIITRWPCVLKQLSCQDIKEFNNPFKSKLKVNMDCCIGCKMCTNIGCPAISFDKKIKKAYIDNQQCVGCGVCSQVCPKNAILKEEE